MGPVRGQRSVGVVDQFYKYLKINYGSRDQISVVVQGGTGRVEGGEPEAEVHHGLLLHLPRGQKVRLPSGC